MSSGPEKVNALEFSIFFSNPPPLPRHFPFAADQTSSKVYEALHEQNSPFPFSLDRVLDQITLNISAAALL